MKHRGLQPVRLMPRRRKLGSKRLSQDFWRAVRLKAVSLPRPGDYLVHVAANDNYFISASEYQTKYLELGTWTADVALRSGVMHPHTHPFCHFAKSILSVRVSPYSRA